MDKSTLKRAMEFLSQNFQLLKDGKYEQFEDNLYSYYAYADDGDVGVFGAVHQLLLMSQFDMPKKLGYVPWSCFAEATFKTYTVPSNVDSIGDNAFSLCENLTSIKLHSGIEEIHEYAFSGCGKLTNIVIPDSVKWIDMGAFYGCHSLTSVTIPSGVTEMWDDTFEGCNNLHIYYEGSKEDWEKIHIYGDLGELPKYVQIHFGK